MDKFNILPIDITLDIFTRLPSESVLDCKLVSKTWRHQIQHPSFSHVHLTRLNRSTTTDNSGKLSFLALSKNKKLYYFEYNENHGKPINRITRMILASPFKDNNSLVGSPNGFKYDNTLLGSFNGLICIRDEPDVSLCICNPMTKEYVILPEPGKNPGRNWSSGFGYLASTNEYKVVTLYREDKDPWTLNVMVYTLGSGNGWRNVAKLDIKTNLVVSTRQGVFLNGALYWVKVRLGVIVVFDLVNEKFLKQLPPPAFPQPPDYCNWTAHAVGVLGGLLVYSATCSKPRYHSQNAGNRFYDIWLSRKGINNYDIKDQEKKYQPLGWTKEFRLNDDNVLEFTKSGGVLSYSSHYLNIFNPNTSTSKMLVDFSTEQFCQVFTHKNTLLSLKEMGEKDTKIMESGYISRRQLKAAIGR